MIAVTEIVQDSQDTCSSCWKRLGTMGDEAPNKNGNRHCNEPYNFSLSLQHVYVGVLLQSER